MKRLLLAAVLTAAPLALADATADGASLFKSKCALCHGPDGKGQSPMGKALKLRDLGSKEVQDQKDEELAAIIADGKEKMPGFKAALSAEEIRALVAHIRTLKK